MLRRLTYAELPKSGYLEVHLDRSMYSKRGKRQVKEGPIPGPEKEPIFTISKLIRLHSTATDTAHPFVVDVAIVLH